MAQLSLAGIAAPCTASPETTTEVREVPAASMSRPRSRAEVMRVTLVPMARVHAPALSRDQLPERLTLLGTVTSSAKLVGFTPPEMPIYTGTEPLTPAALSMVATVTPAPTVALGASRVPGWVFEPTPPAAGGRDTLVPPQTLAR